MKSLLSIIIAALFALTVFPFAALGDGEEQEPVKLPYAYVGTYYHAIAICSYYSGCFPISDFRIKEGELPQGLKMTTEVFESPSPYDTTYSYNVNIEGTPTEKGYYEFVIAFRDWNMDKEVEYPVCMYVVDTYSTIPYASLGKDYEETVLTIDEADTYELAKGTMLPEGMEIADKSDGAKKDILLKGNPEEKGEFFIGIDVKSNEETTTFMYKLTVRDERVHLVRGFVGEIYKDTMFEYPEAEFSTEDTLPKGLTIERTEKKVGEQKVNVFELKGVPEEAGEFVFHVKYTKGESEILTETYVVNIEKELKLELYPVISCVYGVEDETELFFLPTRFTITDVRGNVPEGLEFKVERHGYRYCCMMVGAPKEHMTEKYLFEVEVDKSNDEFVGDCVRDLYVLYVAESETDIGPLPLYRPLEAKVGTDIEGLQSMELLQDWSYYVTLEKQDDGSYLLKISLPINESMLYKLPVYVKYSDKETGKEKDTIIQIKVTIVTQLTGDSNLDSKIDTADAVMVLKYAAGMYKPDHNSEQGFYFDINSDTNSDNDINTADAVLILKYAAGLIDEF